MPEEVNLFQYNYISPHVGMSVHQFVYYHLWANMEKLRTSKYFVDVSTDSIVAPNLDCSSTANPGRIEYAIKEY